MAFDMWLAADAVFPAAVASAALASVQYAPASRPKAGTRVKKMRKKTRLVRTESTMYRKHKTPMNTRKKAVKRGSS